MAPPTFINGYDLNAPYIKHHLSQFKAYIVIPDGVQFVYL